jgi:hypothetical protein
VDFLASNAARGVTEALRLGCRLLGMDVEPVATCLNSICALPASPLVIDSAIFQRTLTLGMEVLLWALVAGGVAFAGQAVVRAAWPGSRTAGVLRRIVTARTVALALSCAIVLSAGAAVLANLRSLARMAPPSSGMEGSVME